MILNFSKWLEIKELKKKIKLEQTMIKKLEAL